MAVPTIVGSIVRVDNSPYVGKLTFYRLAPAMFNNGPLMVLSSLTITTNSSGEFSTSLQPGIYDIETAVGRYPGIPWSRVRVRVPNTEGEINLSDLALETALPDPSYFGGTDGGGGGSVSTATPSTLGVVKLDQSDATAVVMTKKTFTGTDEKTTLFRPDNGSIWIKSTGASGTGLYYKLAVGVFGGTAQLGVESTGVAFEDLPVA